MLIKLAVKNVWRNKRRTLFTELAIVFGVIIIVFTGSFLKGMGRDWALDLINTTTGAFQVEHRDFLEKSKSEPMEVSLSNADAVIREIESIPGILSASGQLKISGMISTGAKATTFNGMGIDILKHSKTLHRAENLIISGRTIGDDPYEIVIGQLLAEVLGVAVGDQLTLVVKNYHGMYDLMYAKLVGIKHGNHFPSATYVEMHLSQAQRLLRMKDKVSQVLVRADDFDSILRYKEIAGTKLAKFDVPFIIRDYTELIEMYNTIRPAFRVTGIVVSVVLFIIVGGGIATAMFMAVRERKKEIGTILAIGMEPTQIRNLFITEGIAIGLIGVIIGTAAAGFVVFAIDLGGGIRFSKTMVTTPLIDWLTVSYVIVMSIIVSIVASWSPASLSSKLDPITALMEN